MRRAYFVSDRCSIKSPFGSNKKFHSNSHLPNLSYQKSANMSSKYTAVISFWLPVHFTQPDSTVKINYDIHWHCSVVNHSKTILTSSLPPTPRTISNYNFQRSNFLLQWNNLSWKLQSNIFQRTPWNMNISDMGISTSGVGTPVGRKKVCGRYKRDLRTHSWLLGISEYFCELSKLWSNCWKESWVKKSNSVDSLVRF